MTSPNKFPRIFRNFVGMLRKLTLKVNPGSPKWPKSVLLRKSNNFLLRPAMQLILSLKYSSWNALTGKNHPCPEKNLYVEKNDFKVTKNRIFGYGILTTFRKSHFSTANIENNYNKVYIAKNYIKGRV